MPTEKWHNVMSVNSSVCAFRLERDRYFVVRYVESALQNNREKHPNLYVPEFNVFPIYLPLDIVNADSKTIPSIISIEVINAIAAAWTRLICKNPDSFHNLSEYDQHLLLEFFIWRFGSAYELQLWLKRYEMQEFSQRMFFEKVDEFSKKQSVKPDAVKKMNEWLTVKPPDLEYAHVLVDLQPTGNKKRDIQVVKQLLTLANSLRKTSIVLKIFTSPISGLREAATPIRWSAENLEKILNSCISRASDNSQLKFSELFWPVPNQNATDLLIKKSKGSLSELLRLGNEVLRIHVDNSPDEYYLDVSDVEKAK
ncbi:MAG: hypothetical protein HYZ24_06080 [Chloroflexi bacterium]|nr:hypothetical protein [Chloroflexota bacterium]